MSKNLPNASDRFEIGCESNLPLRGDHPVRLEQDARGVQKHDDEAEVRCSCW